MLALSHVEHLPSRATGSIANMNSPSDDQVASSNTLGMIKELGIVHGDEYEDERGYEHLEGSYPPASWTCSRGLGRKPAMTRPWDGKASIQVAGDGVGVASSSMDQDEDHDHESTLRARQTRRVHPSMYVGPIGGTCDGTGETDGGGGERDSTLAKQPSDASSQTAHGSSFPSMKPTAVNAGSAVCAAPIAAAPLRVAVGSTGQREAGPVVGLKGFPPKSGSGSGPVRLQDSNYKVAI